LRLVLRISLGSAVATLPCCRQSWWLMLVPVVGRSSLHFFAAVALLSASCVLSAGGVLAQPASRLSNAAREAKEVRMLEMAIEFPMLEIDKRVALLATQAYT